jgi:hypothetical protein
MEVPVLSQIYERNKLLLNVVYSHKHLGFETNLFLKVPYCQKYPK